MSPPDAPEIPYVALRRHQPDGVAWPTADWPTGSWPGGGIDEVVEPLFTDADRFGQTFALLVVHEGRLVFERYAGEVERWDGPNEPVTETTGLLSWSLAKSVLHATVGTLVLDGRLDVDAPTGLDAWQAADDPRGEITLQDLLEMRDGLDFAEVYEIDKGSDVVEMLFGAGQQDMSGYAATKPLAAPPGSRYSYSSGTSNIISRLVASVVGAGEPYRAYLDERVFGPIGMTSAEPKFDGAGVWSASTYLYASARDYARFGYLYLRDGWWDGVRLLPEGWVDHGRRARSVDDEHGYLYGAHWWVTGDEHGTFRGSGYEGQSILVSPGLDLVVVRLGKTPDEKGPNLEAWRRRFVADIADETASPSPRPAHDSAS